jgi:hypothetical protein
MPDASTRSKPRRDFICETLRVLFVPGQVIEVRVPKFPRGKATSSGYFDDHVELAEAVERFDGRANIYVVLNSINPSLLARAHNRIKEYAEVTTADADITGRRWLYLDFDPVRASGISSTDDEHTAALDRAALCRSFLDSQGWPSPVEADSGNGSHLLFRVDLPNDEEADELVRNCLDALDWLFSDAEVNVDTSVANASRICKLYGTLAVKGDQTDERPHRRSRILTCPSRLGVVPLERLEALAARLVRPPPKPRQATKATRTDGEFDLAAWIKKHNLDVVREGAWRDGGFRWVLGTCPWNEAHKDNSAFIVRWPDGMVGAGCHHAGCQGKGWRELRELLEPGCYRQRDSERNGQITATSQPPIFAEPIVASQLPTGGATADYIWSGFIARESVTLLTSLWKAGKTTLLALLLKAMGDGSLLAGRAVTAGKVLVCTEESARLWAGRRDKLKLGDHAYFDIRPFRMRPGFADWLRYVEHLADVVQRYKLSLVCLDTFAAVSPTDDENDASKMMAALTPLRAITDTGAGVLLSHHPRKGDASEGQASRGSGALPGFCDVIVEMRRVRPGERGNRQRELVAYSRFDDTPPELVIELAEDGLSYEALGTSSELGRKNRARVLLGLLPKQAPGWTVEEVLSAWPDDTPKPGERTIRQDLSNGADANKWSRTGEGKSGSPYRYWSNTSTPS